MPTFRDNMLPAFVGRFPTIQIDALFDGPDDSLRLRPDAKPLEFVDLIFLRDRMSGRECLVYGREYLQEIVANGITPPVSGVVVEMDQETNDLEKLTALVRVLRGKNDYEESR